MEWGVWPVGLFVPKPKPKPKRKRCVFMRPPAGVLISAIKGKGPTA
jgi:hypothetical protein